MVRAMRKGSWREKLASGLAGALVATSLAGMTFTAVPITAGAAPAAAEALLIGDSVLESLALGYGAAGRADLAARHSFILDAAACRRLITTSCQIGSTAAPANALTVLRSRAGQYDSVLVVAAGYNDSPTGPVGIGAAIDAMIAEARRQGIDHVIWLTYRVAGSAGNIARFSESNAVLRSRHDPGLLIADWATVSAGLPTSWFSADGVHLGGQAATAMAHLIGDALDRVKPNRCNSGIWSGSDAPTVPADPQASVPGGLKLLPMPVRVIDTRTLPGKLGGGMMLTVPIAGSNGVPVEATAAVVAVTAVEPCADTFLTVFPCGGSPPVASMVNAATMSTVANSAVVRLGAGAICVYSPRATDVLVDVSGWIDATGLRTVAVTPTRLVDTRPGQRQALAVAQQRLVAGGLLTVDVGSWPGAAGATAATVNVTASAPQASGFITVLPGPCAAATLPPSTSSLNVRAGRDVAAAATVGLGGGQLCVYASTATDVVVDLQALHGTPGGATHVVDPRRIVDTRSVVRIGSGQTLPVDLGVVAEAAIVNLTAVAPSGSGFLTLYPCGDTMPTASNLNVVPGVIVANRALVSTGATNRFCLYSSVGTDAVIDVEAYVAG